MKYDDYIRLKICKAISSSLRSPEKETEEIFLRNNASALAGLDHDAINQILNWLELERSVIEIVDSNKFGDRIRVLQPDFDIYLNALWDEEMEDLDDKYAKEKLLHYGPITLDLLKPELVIDNYPPITIKPTKQETKFLQILMQKQGNIAEYTEIAKFIEAGYFRKDGTGTNIYYGEQLRHTKKRLFQDLKKAKLDEKAINILKSMIIYHRNSGYSLKIKKSS